jgi:hypothetical protein
MSFHSVCVLCIGKDLDSRQIRFDDLRMSV